MEDMESIEPCPLCGSASAVRPKLVLIEEAWQQNAGKDYREFSFADIRVDDIVEGALREEPLEQFTDGFYCDHCGKAFVSERILQGERWKHRWT